MNRVTLYSKPGCHLCDVAKQVIQAVQQRRKFSLEVRNIENDSADLDRFRNDIPVIAVNGHEIARHRLSDARLEWGLDTYDESE